MRDWQHKAFEQVDDDYENGMIDAREYNESMRQIQQEAEQELEEEWEQERKDRFGY
jgi:folate-dependent tRNA-U54 methylase TrmFO/GidA